MTCLDVAAQHAGDTRVLDVAGGTGDTAFRIAEHAYRGIAPHNNLEVVVCDINGDMLAEGKRRFLDMGEGGVIVLLCF